MNVFVAGSTVALGAQLLQRLVAAGHDVTGLTLTPGKQDEIRELGACARITRAMAPLDWRMLSSAAAMAVARARPRMRAAKRMPVPSGRVRIRRSPGLRPALPSTASRRTFPETKKPADIS